ncbi:hypothetical protein DY000_02060141 [Brassica cretica]|uniref:Uncharacterized protein n=1 Tax=Brassica cretica TaxID=69181 RepID=A0ABQ7AVH2_BRACR|nr:hypothetical protein DY000_02060141 [Brassica cretica]
MAYLLYQPNPPLPLPQASLGREVVAPPRLLMSLSPLLFTVASFPSETRSSSTADIICHLLLIDEIQYFRTSVYVWLCLASAFPHPPLHTSPAPPDKANLGPVPSCCIASLLDRSRYPASHLSTAVHSPSERYGSATVGSTSRPHAIFKQNCFHNLALKGGGSFDLFGSQTNVETTSDNLTSSQARQVKTLTAITRAVFQRGTTRARSGTRLDFASPLDRPTNSQGNPSGRSPDEMTPIVTRQNLKNLLPPELETEDNEVE